MTYSESGKRTAAGQAVTLAWLLPLLAGLFVFVLRAYKLELSFDIFIDEITYLRISQSVADHARVYLYGEPFFLHPPAWFFIEGAYLKLMGPGGTLIEQIYGVRMLTVLASTVSGGLILLLVQRVAGLAAAVGAVLLFALDPFIVKMNSLNMLETATLMWVLAGYWVIADGLHPDGEKRSLSLPRTFAAGLFFGLAILTKEMALFLTLLPLAGLFVFNRVIERRRAGGVIAITSATYALYPLGVAVSGHWTAFMDQKGSGLERFVGLVKSTGFGHQGGGPSLFDTVFARLDQFASTYAVLVLGVAAVLLLLFRGGELNRLIAFWVGSAYALLAYGIFFGTLEEQFFYYLVVPSIVACAVAGREVVRGALLSQAAVQWAGAAAVCLLLFVGWGGYRWVQTHSRPDNGYASVLHYLSTQEPSGARVASTSETGQFLLEKGYGSGPWGDWVAPEELTSYGPEYLLVDEHSLAWNTGAESRPLLQWIGEHSRPVYTFTGNDDNRLVLYQLTSPQQLAGP